MYSILATASLLNLNKIVWGLRTNRCGVNRSINIPFLIPSLLVFPLFYKVPAQRLHCMYILYCLVSSFGFDSSGC